MKKRRVFVFAIGFAAAVLCTGCSAAGEHGAAGKKEENRTEDGRGADQQTDYTRSANGEAGEESETSTPANIPGWRQHAQDEVTLDWYVNYSWFTTPWGENAVSRAITRETGVDINFITPMGNESEKFNALIASGTLPDLITLGWWENQIDEMITLDMVYPLNQLADIYDAYFWEVADPEAMEWNRKEDGNVYVYPNSFFSPKDYENRDDIASNQTFLVRKDIYEAIGSPDMTTPEGFQNAVRKAAEMYPEVDGEPLIPIGAHMFTDTGCVSFDLYLQNFLAVPYEKDGKYYDRFTDPDYISWLKTFRELGSEGYLARDIFIDQRTQMEEKIARGRYFCMLYQRTDMEAQQKELYANTPERIYMAVDGPKNAAGEDHVLPGTGSNGWTVTLISKNCERPDRAMELLSYLISERGQKMTYLGVEGITYDMMEGIPVIRPEVEELLNSNRAEYDRLYGADNAYWMLQNNAMQMDWKSNLKPPTGQPEEWTYPYTHYLGEYEINFNTNTEAGNADANIKKLWSRVLPGLLLSKSDEEFDSLLREFVQQRQKLGYEAVVEESERQIKEAKKKLGLE